MKEEEKKISYEIDSNNSAELKAKHKEQVRRSNWKIFKWGCLAPFLFIVVIAIFIGSDVTQHNVWYDFFLFLIIVPRVLPVLIIIWIVWFVVLWYNTSEKKSKNK